MASDARPVRIRTCSIRACPCAKPIIGWSWTCRRCTGVSRARTSRVYSIDPCGSGGFEAWVAAKARGLSAPQNRTAAIAARGLPLACTERAAAPDGSRAAQGARSTWTFCRRPLPTPAAAPSSTRTTSSQDSINCSKRTARTTSIGYVQPAANKPGSFHRLEVKVNRPDRQGADPQRLRSSRGDRRSEGRQPSARRLTWRSQRRCPNPEPALWPMPVCRLSRGPRAGGGSWHYGGWINGGDDRGWRARGCRDDRARRRSIELQVSVFTPDGIAVGRPQRQSAPR